MHRLLVEVNLGQEVDHINGNGLDNRKENLRVCTKSQNLGNQKKTKLYGGVATSSKYKGVSWDKRVQKWVAKIGINGKRVYLGLFEDEEKAAEAYNKAALEYFGEFALLNATKINIERG
jgi:hypothetical protein